MNLQKIKNNTLFPALVLPDCWGRSRAPQGGRLCRSRCLLPRPRLLPADRCRTGGAGAHTEEHWTWRSHHTPHFTPRRGPDAWSSGASRPAAGTCSGWSRSPARGRAPGLREGRFRAFSRSDVTETPPFTPSPKRRPGGGGSGEAAHRSAHRSAPLRGAGPHHVPPPMYPICAPLRALNTPIALAVRVCGSALPCGLSGGAGSSEVPPPGPAVLLRLGALPSPGAAPGKRPALGKSRETSLGVRQLLPGSPGSVCVPAPPRHVRLFSVPEKHYRIVTSSHTIIP